MRSTAQNEGQTWTHIGIEVHRKESRIYVLGHLGDLSRLLTCASSSAHASAWSKLAATTAETISRSRVATSFAHPPHVAAEQ
jgi:hypothetical protein